MTKFLYLGLLSALLISCSDSGVNANDSTAKFQSPAHAIPKTEITDDIEMAADAAINAISGNTSGLDKILSAQTTMDGGTNYDLKLQLKDNTVWIADVVMVDNGRLEVKSVQLQQN